MTSRLPLPRDLLRRLTAALLSCLIVMVTVPCTMAGPAIGELPQTAAAESHHDHGGSSDTEHTHHQPVCNLCCVICHAAPGTDPPKAAAPAMAVLTTLAPGEARAAIAATRPSPFEARGPPIRL